MSEPTGEMSVGSEEALLAGADLWVVADLAHSSWARKIDWYLNFQILRSETHRPARPSPELEQVLAQADLTYHDLAPVETVDSPSSPLLVASSDRLPNHAVLVLPFDVRKARDWVVKIHEKWSRLDEPSLRVYLPAGMTEAEFASHWLGPRDVLSRALVVES